MYVMKNLSDYSLSPTSTKIVVDNARSHPVPFPSEFSDVPPLSPCVDTADDDEDGSPMKAANRVVNQASLIEWLNLKGDGAKHIRII